MDTVLEYSYANKCILLSSSYGYPIECMDIHKLLLSTRVCIIIILYDSYNIILIILYTTSI